jgi:hypothetical protein
VLAGSGLLYPSGDEAALAQRLAEALQALPSPGQAMAQRQVVEQRFSRRAFASVFQSQPFWQEARQ